MTTSTISLLILKVDKQLLNKTILSLPQDKILKMTLSMKLVLLSKIDILLI